MRLFLWKFANIDSHKRKEDQEIGHEGNLESYFILLSEAKPNTDLTIQGSDYPKQDY